MWEKPGRVSHWACSGSRPRLQTYHCISVSSSISQAELVKDSSLCECFLPRVVSPCLRPNTECHTSCSGNQLCKTAPVRRDFLLPLKKMCVNKFALRVTATRDLLIGIALTVVFQAWICLFVTHRHCFFLFLFNCFFVTARTTTLMLWLFSSCNANIWELHKVRREQEGLVPWWVNSGLFPCITDKDQEGLQSVKSFNKPNTCTCSHVHR